jgi:hypothetical protein
LARSVRESSALHTAITTGSATPSASLCASPTGASEVPAGDGSITAPPTGATKSAPSHSSSATRSSASVKPSNNVARGPSSATRPVNAGGVRISAQIATRSDSAGAAGNASSTHIYTPRASASPYTSRSAAMSSLRHARS